MEKKTYTGGCHCGKVRYEVTTDFPRVLQCNCSICHKRGLVLTFVGESDFKLLHGETHEYLFNKKVIRHLHCPSCGVESYAIGTRKDGTKSVAINVRCLDGVELDQLTITPFDGRSM
jgi:hypothetical protein